MRRRFSATLSVLALTATLAIPWPAAGQQAEAPPAEAPSSPEPAAADGAPLPALPLAAGVLLAGLVFWGGWRLGAGRRKQLLGYRDLFEQAVEAVLVLDDGLQIVEANRAAGRLLRREGKRLRGRKLTDFVETDQDPAAHAAAALEGTPAEFGGTVPGRRGTEAHVQIRLARLERSEPRLTAIVHDISANHRQFRRYETFLERLIDGLPIEVVIQSREGRYEYLNPVAVEQPELRAWLIGKTDFELCERLGLHAEVALRRRSYRKQVMETRRPVTFEETLPAPDGGTRHVRRTFSPHVDEDGEVSVVACFGVDASEVRRLRDEVTGTRAEAERMARIHEAFLQNLSHELRTPLTGIVGFAQILRDEVPEPLQEFIEDIQRSGNRLMATLNGLLDMAGLQAETVEMKPQIVDLVAEVEAVVGRLREDAEAKGLYLRARPTHPELFACADPGSLERVLSHLVGNAIKFTEEGGVVVDVAGSEEELVVGVMDTGVGIDPEFMPDLFEAFNQEEAGVERSFEGVGLGLAVTKRLVDLMGGRIEVHSDKGQGSLFQVCFPALAAPAAPQERPRVLVVDRSPQAHRVVEHQLGGFFQVAAASRFDEAFAAESGTSYDAALVDLHVETGLSPDELLRRLRQQPALQDAVLVAVDSESLPGRRRLHLDAGYDAYLARPFSRLDALNALIGRLVPGAGADLRAPAPSAGEASRGAYHGDEGSRRY